MWPLSSTPQKHTWRRLGKPTRDAPGGGGVSSPSLPPRPPLPPAAPAASNCDFPSGVAPAPAPRGGPLNKRTHSRPLYPFRSAEPSSPSPLLTGKKQSGYQRGGCRVCGPPGRRAGPLRRGRSGLLPRPRPRRLAGPRFWACFAPTGSTGRAVPARKPEPARREGRARRSRGLGPPRAAGLAWGGGAGPSWGDPRPASPPGGTARRPLCASARARPLHLLSHARAGALGFHSSPGLFSALPERRLCYQCSLVVDPSTPPSDNPFAGKWFYSGARSRGWGCRPG